MIYCFRRKVTTAAVTVERPTELESTARGAAMLAGLGAGLFSSPNDAARMIRLDRAFTPQHELGDENRRAWSLVGRGVSGALALIHARSAYFPFPVARSPAPR